ncbi:hypothetical protein AX17_005832 [Amanita inopinata Kibby_2008]|nr:hypothetical protein AX17_005832 [Amanita inopinata Kibby_2008]
MDYLRTLGSAAVSTLVQKSGLNLPFNLGIKVITFDGICNLYDAIKRDDGSLVSVFEYDFSEPRMKNSKALARNALRKLRTTRHPDVLRFLDAVETDSTLHIMTERVRPLQPTLSNSSLRAQEREDWLLWGLHRISVALAFLNDACTSAHGRICVSSIFITPSGEWKLGGFELLSSPKDEAAVLYTMGSLFPGTSSYAPPEVKKQGWAAIKDSDPAAADGYALGILLHSVFNPSQPPLATLGPPHPPPSANSRGAIPSSVFNSFKRLLNPNPKTRLTPKHFLETGMSQSGFFHSNKLVQVCCGLDNFALSSEAEKNTFLRTLKESASSFPPEFASYRVLPSLVSALEYGGASAATIIPLVLEFGSNIPPEVYSSSILSPLAKLYSSPDRGTRMALLDNLPAYVDKLDKKTASDKVWPHLQTGFSDTVAVIREATTKSIIYLAPKLSDRILNNDLLRLLAKMQTDPEASIRTNTCILIGRLGPSLGYHTKRKVLVPAFARALKDSFVHARVAGLMSFMATIDCFEVEDIATKVIPNMSFTMIDKEKLVREQAFKAIDLFVKRLESHAVKMPEIAATDTGDALAQPLQGQTGLVNTAAGAAGALAGWAITSLGKKLAASDLQSTIDPVASTYLERFNHVDSPAGKPTSPMANAAPSSAQIKGMQLPLRQRDVSFEEFEAQTEIEDTTKRNPWGNDDLIDINADQDDWSAFEVAPTINEPRPVLAQSENNNLTTANVASLTGPRSHEKVTLVSRKAATAITQMKGQGRNLEDLLGSPASSRLSTPISSPRPDRVEWDEAPGWDSEKRANIDPAPTISSLAGLSKEEKATELARRKEERKQRIAQLKAQKRNPSKT